VTGRTVSHVCDDCRCLSRFVVLLQKSLILSLADRAPQAAPICR
jgi:hypothetical protein